ncbi:MAG: undecaprenyldiphospho-muramoylpentapeptide beta-N-acetylglucosaminyltransferase [Chloroflexi bacterium HGW-Chloroflexi-8]|nr:MAG: undecaprenyldiphospho-muramoylpentapeptide beta-N-acetylglucosaminyltransferase [Chloroflexi bacterium HGW-Chloroflexi-8]
MRLLICAGGTGSGVYPALAILQAIENRIEQTLWVGGQGGMEFDLISRLGIPFTAIPAAGVHGVGISHLPANLWKLFKGISESRKIIRKFNPDVILYSGGYVAAPMAIAARNVPSVLFVPDIEPGLALKFLARFASKIALTSQASQMFFNNQSKLLVTGYPTRSDLKPISKNEALAKLNLSNHLPVIFFFGGSKGARSINRALAKYLPDLLKKCQIIHITGQLDWNEIKENTKNLEIGLLPNYHVFPYLHEEMAAAFSSADLVVSRAGASTLGELPLFGTPAILVPYPYAWRYQKVNAQYLVDQGAAILLNDEELETELLNEIEKLLENPEKLMALKTAMKKLYQPGAAIKIGELIMTSSAQRNSERGMA